MNDTLICLYISPGPPSLLDFPEQTVTVVEGDSLTVDGLDNEFVPETFPFPQSVQWYKDGAAVENDTGRMVTLGYPDATFGQVNREDRGVYTISATNYRLDDGNVVVGRDNASFSLTVICMSLFYIEACTGSKNCMWLHAELKSFSACTAKMMG